MKDEMLANYQSSVIELAKKIILALEKNKVNYFAVYGTCLGALRHRGIIPWDDDIDIGVLREDYPVLMDVIRNECRDLYAWDLYEDAESSLPYGRIFNRLYDNISKEDRCAYVDIFIYDNLPTSSLVVFLKDFVSTLIHHRLPLNAHGSIYYSMKLIRSWVLYFLGLPLKFFPVSTLRGFYTWVVTTNQKTDCLCSCYRKSQNYGVPRRFFEGVRYEQFEDFKIRVPKLAEEYLAYTYGKWSEFPRLEDRHGNAFSDKGDWQAEHPRDELRVMSM